MRKFRLRPSAAASWVLCSASVSLREGYPDESGEAAEVGTAAHWVGERMLRALTWGVLAPNGVLITPEIISGTTEYYEHVKLWGIPVYVEKFLHCAGIHDECGGTPDVWGYCWETNTIRICDFKFGFRMVDAYENWQMICYISGIVTLLHSWGVDTTDTRVIMTVVQPRTYRGAPEIWETSVEELEPYFMELRYKANLIVFGDTMAQTGPQCINCSANRACVTLQKSGHIACDISGLPHLLDLTVEQASRELAQLEAAAAIIASRKSGLESQLVAALYAGQSSPEHVLERVVKREVWQEGAVPQVILMGQLLGKDFKKPDAAITPAAIRRLGVDESLIKAYSFRPQGEQKLVRRSTRDIRKFSFGE